MTAHHASPTELSGRLDRLGVLLVCGSGGVGKTSVAAAIALDEAMRGRRVCVITIDPAKRLAQAMGLTRLEDRERKVKLPQGGTAGGSLHALMLDPKTAFDRMVTETASTDEERDRILGNRVYQQVSGSSSGTQEYMALERLYELDRGGKYDLIVVDTPPAAHAKDMLESPHRMLRFLEGKSLRWFLKPGAKAGKLGLKALGGSNGPVVGLLQKITGAEMLRDTTEFLESMEGIYGSVSDRIRVVDRMFGSPNTGFLAVTSPERESVDQAVAFWELLEERRYCFVGTVVNRVEPPAPGTYASDAELDALEGIDESLAARIAAAQVDHSALASRDRSRLDELARETGDALTISIPRLARMVNDLDGLRALAPYLHG
ncbi:MAG: ArsA family ATPase [Thermoleophilia bacterium]|nr:ArsA family ATPase [Thermoleophilia bacterium]MCZ4496004.1 ArsA family ATPase [Thermoleophilia bacterium]